MNFKKLISKGEGQTLEFKRSLKLLDDILITICSFSNADGGKILVGVTDKGEVVGITIGKKTIQKLLNQIKFSIEPTVIPQVETYKINERDVLVITVSEGLNKPYFLRGMVYRRVGNSNQRLGKEDIEKLIIEKHKRLISFEEKEIETDLSVMDLNRIKEFVEVARRERKVNLGFSDVRDFLRKTGLIRRKPTNAAILCFAKNPQTFLPYFIVKCGKFRDNRMIFEREVAGTVFNQIFTSLEFIKENLSFESKIDEKGKRKEIYEIPLESIRESVVNAVCHRDYTIASPIYIKIFRDRVEVISPGKLLEPLTPEKLKQDHPSILRNPKIANILFLYGFIERWGQGTNKMVRVCLERGLQEPEFLEENGFFKVILYRRVLKETERLVLEILREKKEMTSKELAQKLEVGERTARKYLSSLKKRGLISERRIGRRIIYFL